MPLSGDDASGSRVATTEGSPEEPSAQIALTRDSPSAESSALVRPATASGGSGGSSRPIASARYCLTRGSSSFAASNAFTSAGAERAVGPDLRIAHQP